MSALGEGERRATLRAWTWVLWIVVAFIWFGEMSVLGFSKPQHNATDPVSAAAYNHQQNAAWAGHVFWVCALPFIGAALGALVAGSDRQPGVRKFSVALGAALGALVVAAVAVFIAVVNFRIAPV